MKILEAQSATTIKLARKGEKSEGTCGVTGLLMLARGLHIDLIDEPNQGRKEAMET